MDLALLVAIHLFEDGDLALVRLEELPGQAIRSVLFEGRVNHRGSTRGSSLSSCRLLYRHFFGRRRRFPISISMLFLWLRLFLSHDCFLLFVVVVVVVGALMRLRLLFFVVLTVLLVRLRVPDHLVLTQRRHRQLVLLLLLLLMVLVVLFLLIVLLLLFIRGRFIIIIIVIMMIDLLL